MRLSWQPQPGVVQVVFSGSWRCSTRSSCGGSGARFGVEAGCSGLVAVARSSCNWASSSAMSAFDGFVEQGLLLRVELLALDAELRAPQLRHLEAQLVDLGVAPVDLAGVTLDAGQQRGGQFAKLDLAQRLELGGVDLRCIEHERSVSRQRPRHHPRMHGLPRACACTPASNDADRARFAEALPGQSEDQCIQLRLRQRQPICSCAP